MLVCIFPFFVLRQRVGLLLKLFGVHSSCVLLRIDWECGVAGYVAWSCNVIIFFLIDTRWHNTSPSICFGVSLSVVQSQQVCGWYKESREAAVLGSVPSGGKSRRWDFTGDRGQALGSCSAFLVVLELWLRRVLSSPVWLLLHTAGCT